MSLTFQLTRGLIALPLLAALAAAAWLAPAPANSAVARAAASMAPAVSDACALPVAPLRLASAPADLPRRENDCRV